jgi:hypothetical protein
MKIRYWIVISVLIWNVVVIITLLAASPKNIDSQNNSAIINLLSGKCMDPEGINAENGTLVQLNDCDASSDQNWEIDNNNYLIHTASGKCLDVPGASGSANSAKLQLWDCEWDYQDTDQRWSLTSDGFYRISSPGSAQIFQVYPELKAVPTSSFGIVNLTIVLNRSALVIQCCSTNLIWF